MRPHVSGTERSGFSKARCLWESGSSVTTVDFPFPPSAESVCCECLLDGSWFIPFFLTKILELTLSCVSQATQYSSSMESPEDIQLVNKGWLLLVRWQLSCSCFAPSNSAALPCYEYFAAEFSTYPCHMAFIACLMTAFFALRSRAIVRTFLATMLCSGGLY